MSWKRDLHSGLLLPERRMENPSLQFGFQTFGLMGGASEQLTLLGAIQRAGLTSNLRLCLDAGDTNSYGGSGQSWLDRSGNGHDFFLGLTSGSETTDPVFTGTAGDLSNATYFAGDDTSGFAYDTTTETWMQNLHKDGAAFSWIICQYKVANAQAFGSRWNDPGIEIAMANGSNKQSFVATHNSGVALAIVGDLTIGDGWHIQGGTINENGGAGASFLWQDGAYNPVSSSNTFNGAYSSPSSSNAGGGFGVFTGGVNGTTNFNNNMPNGSRAMFIAIWSTTLTKTNLDDLFGLLRSRPGI